MVAFAVCDHIISRVRTLAQWVALFLQKCFQIFGRPKVRGDELNRKRRGSPGGRAENAGESHAIFGQRWMLK